LSLRNRLLNHKDGSKVLALPHIDVAAFEDLLAAGETIELVVDGGAPQLVTLAGVTAGVATAAEIAANLTAQLAGAQGVVDGMQVRVVSDSPTGSVICTGGTAIGGAKLDFTVT
jgi:hypothetical protein